MFNEGFEYFSNFWLVLNDVFFILGDPPVLNVMCRRFGTVCQFHLHRTTYEDGTERTHNIQTSGNHPKERIQIIDGLNLENVRYVRWRIIISCLVINEISVKMNMTFPFPLLWIFMPHCFRFTVLLV